MKARHLDEPSQLFEALFEIYNLASTVRKDQAELESSRHRIAKLRNEITKNFQDTFTGAKKTHNKDPTKESRTNNGNRGGHAGGAPQHDEDVYDNYEVAQTFAEARYSLESNGEDENGWAPLNEVQTTKHFGIC
jgi:hypothetical protein